MGIFSFLSSENRRVRKIEKNIRRANNKHTPKDYRKAALFEVMEAARGGDEMALSGLLARFGVNAEPSIEDEKEKEWVCDVLIEIGQKALPRISKVLRTAESVNWAQRVLRNIVSEEEYKSELLDVLSDFDTEYERNPDRKIQTIMALSEVNESDVTEALLRFLEDVDETVRFQTVEALFLHKSELSREDMLKAMCQDSSIRVKNRIIECFAELEWSTTGYKKQVEKLLQDGFKMEKSGKIVKLSRG